MRALVVAAAVLLPVTAGAAPLDEASLGALFDGAAVHAKLGAPSVAAGAAAPRPAPLSAEDVAELTAVFQGASQASAEWPGYDLLSKPLLIVRPGGRSFLIGHPHPPADFSAQTVAGRVVYVSDAPRDPGFPYRFDYPVDGVPATVLRTGEHGSAEDAALIVHEGFHKYQKGWTERSWGPYRVEDADDVAGAQAEQLALARALEAGAAWRGPAREFLALRRSRRQRHPEIADAEDWTEQAEGTALFVENHAVPDSANGGPLAPRLRYRLSLENMPRDRFYMTGAAIAQLLDRVGPGWRGRVEAGASLYELLAQALALPDAEADRLAAAALASPEYSRLRADAAAEIAAFQAERAAALARFDAQPGVRLSVPGHGAFSTVKWYKLPQGGDLFDPADPFVLDERGWLFRVEGRALLETDKGNVAVVDPALILVDGAPWDRAPGSRAFKTLSLSMPGVTVRLQGGTLSFDGRTLAVTR